MSEMIFSISKKNNHLQSDHLNVLCHCLLLTLRHLKICPGSFSQRFGLGCTCVFRMDISSSKLDSFIRDCSLIWNVIRESVWWLFGKRLDYLIYLLLINIHLLLQSTNCLFEHSGKYFFSLSSVLLSACVSWKFLWYFEASFHLFSWRASSSSLCACWFSRGLGPEMLQREIWFVQEEMNQRMFWDF